MNNHPLQINPQRFLQMLEQLAKIGRQADGAVHRPAYSAADRAARSWLSEQLRAIGLEPQLDAIGNTTVVYPGRHTLPPIAIGSHSDTVPYGGAYDGALGMVAALETILAMHEAAFRPKHPIMWINFAAEEATMAGGTTGSQVMSGSFNIHILDKASWDGQPVRDHLTHAGLDPDKVRDAQRGPGDFTAFLELHIEQSDRLEVLGRQIALVDGFVGIRRYTVEFVGQANHAGTTPMGRRQDALVMAAPLIHFVRDTAIEIGIVGTIGDFNVHPGAPNVIPQRVELVVEIRGLDVVELDRAETLIQQKVTQLGGHFSPIVKRPPVTTDTTIFNALRTACHKLELTTITMPSGAGHDAMNMSRLCPQSIFFVPSKDGISHSKHEYTTPEDCINGARVMLETVCLLDQQL